MTSRKTFLRSRFHVALLAAVPILLSACASAPQASNNAASASTGTTLYCFRDRVYTANGELVCNWATSAVAACKDNATLSRLPQNALVGEPTKSSRCANGEWLVEVTRKGA